MRLALFQLAIFAALTFCIASAAAAQDGQARVPLVLSDAEDPIVASIFEGIRSRGGQPLNMHRTVANSPAYGAC